MPFSCASRVCGTRWLDSTRALQGLTKQDQASYFQHAGDAPASHAALLYPRSSQTQPEQGAQLRESYPCASFMESMPRAHETAAAARQRDARRISEQVCVKPHTHPRSRRGPVLRVLANLLASRARCGYRAALLCVQGEHHGGAACARLGSMPAAAPDQQQLAWTHSLETLMAQNNAAEQPVEGSVSLGGAASLEGLEDLLFGGGVDARDPPALAQLLASPRDETTTMTGHLNDAMGGLRGGQPRISLQEACQSTLYGGGL